MSWHGIPGLPTHCSTLLDEAGPHFDQVLAGREFAWDGLGELRHDIQAPAPKLSVTFTFVFFSHLFLFGGHNSLLGSVSFSHRWQRSALHWALGHWGFLHAEVACAYSWQTWAWGGHIYQLSPEDSEKKIQKVGLEDTLNVRNAVPELSLSPDLSLACSIWKGGGHSCLC